MGINILRPKQKQSITIFPDCLMCRKFKSASLVPL